MAHGSHVVVAVVGCLYVAGSIWIVRYQGQSYRNGLTKRKPAVKEIAGGSRRDPRRTTDSLPGLPPPRRARRRPNPQVPGQPDAAPLPAIEAYAQAIAVDRPSPSPASESAKTVASAPAMPKTALAPPAGNAVPATRFRPIHSGVDPIYRVWDLGQLNSPGTRAIWARKFTM